MMKLKYCILLIISLLTISVASADIPERPNRLVSDYANVLNATQLQEMEQRLVALDDSTSNQIVVVTLTDLEGYEIADYATQLGRKWGVGQKEHDNGVVIIVKIKNETKGQAFIAPGYGLEGALPDATCKHIVEREMIPKFKENDYCGGINAALDIIIPIVCGEHSYEDYEDSGFVAGIFVLIMFIVIVVLMVWASKHDGGTTYSSGGTHTSGPVFWGGGGSSSWGGSSGGGFGGFGGGSFGGGGAGGSW